MSDIAIKVENLSKRYRIGLAYERPDTFAGAIVDWFKLPFCNFRYEGINSPAPTATSRESANVGLPA